MFPRSSDTWGVVLMVAMCGVMGFAAGWRNHANAQPPAAAPGLPPQLAGVADELAGEIERAIDAAVPRIQEGLRRHARPIEIHIRHKITGSGCASYSGPMGRQYSTPIRMNLEADHVVTIEVRMAEKPQAAGVAP
jgi:hypothetical protein